MQGVAARPAIRAPRDDNPELRNTVRHLRQSGEIVVCQLAEGDAAADDPPGFTFDRLLVEDHGRWTVQER